MDEKDEIQKILTELEKLNAQLYHQKTQVDALRKRLTDLGVHTNNLNTPIQPHGSKVNWSAENFIGLRLIHFIGIIVLVIGLSIGVKYAIDKNLISEGMRVALAYGAGILLYLLSVTLKKKYRLFSAILFSGGMSSLYFTTYGAFVYYSLFSFVIAFIIMVVLTVFTVYQAIRYDSQEIALLGLVGAYGIPFLISKNSDRADLFFLYIAIINVAVAYLSIRKKWKSVCRVANAITIFLFMGWVIARFNGKWQTVGASYMCFFFLLFFITVIAIKIFHKTRFTLNDTYQVLLNDLALYISGLFLFGFSFDNSDISYITLALCIFAALQSALIYMKWPEELLMKRVLVSLALTFFILFIAFKWSGIVVTFLWLLCSVILFIVGVVIKSVPARLASIILMGITLVKLMAVDSLTFTTLEKILSYIILGVLLLIVSFFYQKFKDQLFKDEVKS
jgi:uncharacterized membrane protein